MNVTTWVLLAALVAVIIGLAFGLCGLVADKKAASMGTVSVTPPDRAQTTINRGGLILKSGIQFNPSTPSIVSSPLTMDGKWDYVEPTYLVGFEECRKDPAGSKVWVCCAAGFETLGVCALPK